jgi:hypothetical protein
VVSPPDEDEDICPALLEPELWPELLGLELEEDGVEFCATAHVKPSSRTEITSKTCRMCNLQLSFVVGFR